MSKKYIFLFLIAINICFSQEEMPIQPEETPYLLKKNGFQFENGIIIRKINNNHFHYFLPSSLIKYGITNKFELRVILEHFIDNNPNERNLGLNPIFLGLKAKLWKAKKWIPEAALVAQVGINDTGNEKFQLDEVAPDILLSMQGDYNNWFSVNYNLGLKWDGFNKIAFYNYKITGNALLLPFLTYYAENFANFHPEYSAQFNINNGLMFQLTPNNMIDISGGVGLSDTSAKWFSALIYSFRF